MHFWQNLTTLLNNDCIFCIIDHGIFRVLKRNYRWQKTYKKKLLVIFMFTTNVVHLTTLVDNSFIECRLLLAIYVVYSMISSAISYSNKNLC